MYSVEVDGRTFYGHSAGQLIDAVKSHYEAKLATARRDATIAALEALPCENVKFKGFWRSCIDSGFADLCPRCRALAVAKGGK